MEIAELHRNFMGHKEYSTADSTAFFDKNGAFLERIQNFHNKDELKYYAELYWHWLRLLHTKKLNQEVIERSSLALRIITGEADRLHVVFDADEWFMGILFLRGLAFYSEKKYKLAFLLFKKLVLQNPGNEKYQPWLEYSRIYWRRSILKYIFITSVFLLAAEIIMRVGGFKWRLRLVILAISLTGMLFSLVLDFFLKKSFNKISNNSR